MSLSRNYVGDESEDVWPLDEEVDPESWDELRDLLMRRTTRLMVYRGQRKYN